MRRMEVSCWSTWLVFSCQPWKNPLILSLSMRARVLIMSTSLIRLFKSSRSRLFLSVLVGLGVIRLPC